MLKKSITFNDFDGVTHTEDFFFNLTKAELVELEVSEKDGLSETLSEIVKSGDGAQIIENFKKIILKAYGQKSEDGRRFIKTQELRDEFMQTEAYSELFITLATDADAAAEFINGIVPSSLAAATEKVALPDGEKDIKDMTREELISLMHKKAAGE